MFKVKKSTDLELNGIRFTIYHWSPTQVIKNIPKIGKLLAVPLGTVAGSVAQGGATFHEAIPTAILYLLEKMEEGGMEVIDLMLEGIEVNNMGGKMDIDAVFEDHPEDLFLLLQKVIEVNYSCFFGKSGFGSILGLLQKVGMVQAVQNLGQDQTPPETQAQD